MLIDALPHPLLILNQDNMIADANLAAESFFVLSRAMLARHKLEELVPYASPLLPLIAMVRENDAPVNEYHVDLSTPRNGSEKIVDIYASPFGENQIVLMLQERGMAEKINRQLTSRAAARSVTGLAAMLAHEIKNPLSGIKGAAQLLESSVNDDDRVLTRLIVEETDRITKLVDRMEVFSDERPLEREAVNIHAVLSHCKTLAGAGFARHIRLVEDYDPSLPPVSGNRDQLVQVFLNLIKNAAEAINGQGDNQRRDGEIILSTAFKTGVRVAVSGSRERLRLPFEVTIRDNGAGIPPDILPNLFDPFVTTKTNGTGLGLALVAKIISGHGGMIECESQPRKTIFRILLPLSEV
jgi:two-component system, NtrC family, nitrogen regulation sensor histidine kinase GlnL